MAQKGSVGTSMSIVRMGGNKARARRNRKQEQAWKAKSGPVTTYFVDPSTLRSAE